ncbi:NADP-dependent oxidoreductase [Humidisolicoccus flavus]|uniref:NADP-dependent oxidoreductase n=1 Tax=Humidisolicoccus flavus TaxID=3111414 RepID=UPI0032436591
MRAVTVNEFGPPSVATVSEIETPKKLSAEVLIDVRAAGLNPIDAKTRAGGGVAAGIQAFPWVPGNDFAGTIREAVYEHHDLKVGDAVYGIANPARMLGSFAEVVAVSSLSIARKPETLSFVEAAAVPVAGLTAWDAIVRVARAHSGQRVLIHAAAGGVGHFAVQFARYFGAHVIGTASGKNLDFVRSLGANEVVDYKTERFEEVVDKVDVVLDLIGNVHDDTGSRSLNVLRQGGLYINVPTGSWPEYAEAAKAAQVRATGVKVEPDGANLSIISRLIDAGDVKVEVASVLPMDEAAQAFETLEAGHVRGKLVLKVA